MLPSRKGSVQSSWLSRCRLPAANGLVVLNYLAYDHTGRLLWVPAAITGSVEVIDTTTDQIKRVEGLLDRTPWQTSAPGLRRCMPARAG